MGYAVENIKGKRVWVTGGAGFIGSNLCEALLKKNAVVICLDNFITGKKENISEFLKNKNFKCIEGDIRNIALCRKATKNIDYVFHQAALGSVPRSIKDPVTTNDININGFLNILLASKENKVKRFIYASSSSVYGDNSSLPKSEENIGKPLSPYAVTKQVNELYAGIFSTVYEMEIIGLRYFNVFGKRQDPEGPYAAAIPKFIQLLLKGKSPVIYGKGKQFRDFTFVENVVAANLLALSTTNKNALNQVFNIACGKKTTLNELYGILTELLSEYKSNIKNIRPIYSPERKGDIKESLASIVKAKKVLGYKPECDIKACLKRSIRWYVDHLG
jgi:UDP-N-acetylglucosamine/UDP-N-acetylgalactosamine 4-epimerase